MTINITGTLVPASSSFGIGLASDLIGGMASYATETTIGAINTSRLTLGQEAYAQGSGIKYLLDSLTPGNGFANARWSVAASPTNAGLWSGVDTVATTNISLSGEQTLHGVTTSGSRVLVTAQTTAAQNGPYVSASGAWTRATDADSSGEFTVGKLVSVTNGASDLFGTIWTCSAVPTTLGTDPIAFVENAASGTSFNPSAPGDIGGSTPGAGTFTDLVTTVSNLFGNTIAFANGVSNFDGLKSVNYTADADKDITGIPNAYNGPVLKIKATVGGGLTAPRKLTVPFGGPWFVINTTTQTINFGNGSSTIAIAAGAMAVVMSDLTATFYGESGGSGGLTLDTTVRTSSFSPTAGNEYQVDPSGVSFAAPLPSTPNVGDEIRFSLVGNCDASHTFTINAAGAGILVRDWVSNTDGASTVFNRVGLSFSFRYVGGTLKTWRVSG